MAAKKKAGKQVKGLKARTVSAKKAKGVKGGSVSRPVKTVGW